MPTKIYTAAIKPLLESGNVKAIAHITGKFDPADSVRQFNIFPKKILGGGLLENIPRVLVDHLTIQLDFDQINLQPVFAWLAVTGNISDTEMQRTYNCGIGLVLIVRPADAAATIESLTPYGGNIIGTVLSRAHGEPQVRIDSSIFAAQMARVQRHLYAPKRRVAVLISGSGSNLQALIDATRCTAMGIGAEIVMVISNKPGVRGLERAEAAGIPSAVLNHRDFATREAFDAAMTAELLRRGVELVCLAGFMRILSAEFVREWRGRLLNIHPSLLPAHPGLHVQRRALEAGDEQSGCTVHFVDEGVDTGRIILQRSVRICAGETEDSLTQKILVAEHYSYPVALRMVATGVISL